MEKKRVEPRKGLEEECNSNSTVAVDRISKLPDLVVHHILSFVPTVDAVRTSLLSRRWRRVWYSVPTLQFSEPDSFHKRESFNSFVEQCLVHRRRAMRYITDSVVTRFKLSIEYYGDSAALDKWLAFAVQSNVEELDLCTEPNYLKNDLYYLPEAVLNARSLRILKMDSLNLVGSFSTISLPALKYLSLMAVKLRVEVLHNLLLGCPSLEKFLLKKCDLSGFWTLRIYVTSPKLKFLEIDQPGLSQELYVRAMNLESFEYGGVSRVINLSACRAIRSLSLLSNCISDSSLEDLISRLPLLENLSLCSCLVLKRIRICGENLKTVRLEKSCTNQEEVEATIEAPNLISFCYKGDTKFSLSMKSPSRLSSGNFTIREYSDSGYVVSDYVNVITFLTNVNSSWKCIDLHVESEEALIIPENLRRICRSPWPNLKHLKVKTLYSLKKKSDLKEALHWISPSLETLAID